MKNEEKHPSLDTIIREAWRLRDLAAGADEGFLAFLLENVLHEAQATQIGAGHEPSTDGLHEQSGSSVVHLPHPWR